MHFLTPFLIITLLGPSSALAQTPQPLDAPTPNTQTPNTPETGINRNVPRTPAGNRILDPYRFCTCPTQPDDLVVFTGIPKDALLTLGPDGLSALPRQATIFTVVDDQGENLEAEVKVWHVTNPSDCGVTFDYGKRYQVNAHRKDGSLETSWCIDPRRSIAG